MTIMMNTVATVASGLGSLPHMHRAGITPVIPLLQKTQSTERFGTLIITTQLLKAEQMDSDPELAASGVSLLLLHPTV